MRKKVIPYGEIVPDSEICNYFTVDHGTNIRTNPVGGTSKIDKSVIKEIMDMEGRNRIFQTVDEYKRDNWSVFSHGYISDDTHDKLLDGIGLLSHHWGKAKIPNIVFDRLFQSLRDQIRMSLSGCFSEIHQLRWDKRVEELFNKYLLMNRFDIDDQFTIEEEDIKDFLNVTSDEYDPKIHTDNVPRKIEETIEDMKKDVYKKIDLEISDMVLGVK